MKLIIQIPCYNEEGSLPSTLADLPTEISGIDTIVVLIIDDGSIDKTVEIAKKNGVQNVIRHKSNKGLASALKTGLEKCFEMNADIIGNTDADNQ